MRRRVLVGAAVVVLLCTLLVGLPWAFQRHLVYLPDAGPVPPAAQAVPGARDVVLETDDGLRLGAWFVPARTPDAPGVLVANGNGGHRGMRAPLARALADEGLAVLLFDYRGYGGNPGSPSEEGLARDVRAARDFLLGDGGVPADRVVYFGESLGAAVVTGLAVEHPPAGLVLRSPFVDLAAVGSEHYPFLPVRALLRDRYPVAERVRGIEVPTTVVHGGADSIVPPAQSRAVADDAAALHRVVEVPGADHNDPVLLAGDEVVAAVVELASLNGG
ncbi:alpha/beta hydrolase [Blastococcus sp. MG754426]|uniref:alpha/beta hydrolase n=1 Tax=unclassified Blastococcus TaxID=2619396 RepID=UPI001EF0721E|nr:MULTISPECIES: alpha/beta fold hydrolase [unclassified Blastococcus]MCF6506515.1 alpha/beta hydrolase [Blastococcus sp. MG754426]MCF6511202.1 alpha/beta hydrolase [Blastococcus sp. MG754427]MCF6734445.1 alpha/beta hydrolase [Blastococcus sp. KM273129]